MSHVAWFTGIIINIITIKGIYIAQVRKSHKCARYVSGTQVTVCRYTRPFVVHVARGVVHRYVFGTQVSRATTSKPIEMRFSGRDVRAKETSY